MGSLRSLRISDLLDFTPPPGLEEGSKEKIDTLLREHGRCAVYIRMSNRADIPLVCNYGLSLNCFVKVSNQDGYARSKNCMLVAIKKPTA